MPKVSDHIQHLYVFHFFKLVFSSGKTYRLGYEIGQNIDEAYLKLTGRIYRNDRRTELHTIWSSTTD